MEQQVIKSYYAIIPASVRYDEELVANAKLLYGEITALCNEKGFCWASNDYFANLYHVSKKSISRWINQLSNKGYIKSELIYKDGTSEILYRYLYICNPIDKNKDTYRQKSNNPTDKSVHTTMDKKVKDNNTLINNTSNNTSEYKKHIVEIVNYLNDTCSTSYRSTSKETQKFIIARLNDGFTVDDFKTVISKKNKEWSKNKDMVVYLRPKTLFGTNFESYLNQKETPRTTVEGHVLRDEVDIPF